MNIWQIIIDVAIVFIAAISIFLGVKRGFVKSFFKCTKMIIVILLTVILGSNLIGICQEHIVNDMFDGKISSVLVQKIEQSGESVSFEDMTSDLPVIVKNLIPMDELEKHFESLSGSSADAAYRIGTEIEKLVIDMVSKAIAYVGAFVISFIVCSILIFLIEKFWEIPVLNKVNRVMGCIWGIASAYITISFILLVLSIFVGYEFIDGTIFARLLYKIGLFTV